MGSTYTKLATEVVNNGKGGIKIMIRNILMKLLLLIGILSTALFFSHEIFCEEFFHSHDNKVTNVYMDSGGTIVMFNIDQKNSIFQVYAPSKIKDVTHVNRPFSLLHNIYSCPKNSDWLCLLVTHGITNLSIAIPNYQYLIKKGSSIPTNWCFNGFFYRGAISDKNDLISIVRYKHDKAPEFIKYHDIAGVYQLADWHLASTEGIFSKFSKRVSIQEAIIDEKELANLLTKCPSEK